MVMAAQPGRRPGPFLPPEPFNLKPFLLRALVALGLLTPLLLTAQTPIRVAPGSQLQLQVTQPAVDNSSPVTATAAFDPPAISAGGKTFYRVTFDATESSVDWPEQLAAPAGLQFGSKYSGQVTQMRADQYRPLAAFVYEVTALAAGRFVVPGFTVNVSGVPVTVPAATLEVVTNLGLPPPRRLHLDVSATNVFLGETIRTRVVLPPGPGNETEALREIQLHGEGLMVDKTQWHQSIEPISLDGGDPKPAFICEMPVTPITAGPLTFSAQGFTAGREFTAPISIRGPVSFAGGPPKYELLVSEAAHITVRPLPVEGELPGFTGAIGRFFADPPHLSANRVHVGEPLRLSLTFHGEGELTRFAPPAAPLARDWQIIADPPPATAFTLIPLTDEVHETPTIPFSYFDPETAKYVNLSVPSVPVTVVGEGLPAELPAVEDGGKTEARLKLSPLAPVPGKSLRTLRPLQLQGWFIGVELVPVAGLVALWRWDRRRRYLEAHPDIVRRARARRALRRERQTLQQAAVIGDADAFIQHAAYALRIAVAPHYPAEPRALVAADVLAQLDEAAQTGQTVETVRRIFAADDAHYAATPLPPPAELLALSPGVQSVLQKLEEKL